MNLSPTFAIMTSTARLHYDLKKYFLIEETKQLFSVTNEWS